MSVWAIIPVKPLTMAKSRLAGVLTTDKRQQLAETLMRHVVATAKRTRDIAEVLVVSRDSRALAIARELGARTLQESDEPNLNTALNRATQFVGAWRASGVLILPADLPLVSEEDLRDIVHMGEREETGVVIATDRSQDGTNALFVSPPGLFDYAFGLGSYRRHMALGEAAGATVKVYHSERLLLDIDMPADLAQYERMLTVQQP